MAVFFIGYDLQSPGQDYDRITTRLEELGAQRILESVWVMRRDGVTEVAIRDHLLGYVDQNDRVLVVNGSSWAGKNVMVDPAKV